MNSVFVEDWLNRLALTLNKGALEEHLELISENVNILTGAGDKNLNYQDRIEYCRQRFQSSKPHHISYREMRIKTITPARVKFVATETLERGDGETRAQGKEFIIQREEDGQWRAVQERYLGRREQL